MTRKPITCNQIKQSNPYDAQMEAFLVHCRDQRRLSPESIRVYRLDLAHFSKFLDSWNTEIQQSEAPSIRREPIQSLSQVTRGVLEEYRATLRHYAVKTIKHKLACLRSLFRYLEDRELIQQNPFYRFHLDVREPYKLRAALSVEEMNLLLETVYRDKPGAPVVERVSAGGHGSGQRPVEPWDEEWQALEWRNQAPRLSKNGKPLGRPRKESNLPRVAADKRFLVRPASLEFIWCRDVAILELLFAGGLRVSELCVMKYQDLDLHQMVIMIHGKGNKERLIFLENQEVIDALQHYLILRQRTGIDSPYVFLTKFGDRLTTQAVRNLVTKYAEESGMTRKITPHVFRHTFASLLLEEGVDIKYIQDFLGHSSITTTQIYLHTTNRQKRRIMAQNHPRQKMVLTGNSTEDNIKLSSEGEDNLHHETFKKSPS